MKHIPFTKIKQFRNIVTDVRKGTDYPSKLTFEGSVKLHGTNAGVSFSHKEGIWFQSRKNIITPMKDNAGFAFFANSRISFFEMAFEDISKEGYITTIFGEWCGKGIQKGVAISELDKRFVIFAIKYTNEVNPEDHWYEKPKSDLCDSSVGIYNIYNFTTYSIDIDFEYPQLSQNSIRDLVEKVEEECPFAKWFGVSGIGEGIVWCSYDGEGHRTHIFKAKGQKHSSSKVKTVAAVDVDKINSIKEFVEYAVTENRLKQGIEQVFVINSEIPDIKKTGDFLRWVISDVISEEADTMVENGIEPKEFGKYGNKVVRDWFTSYLENNI